MSLTVALLTTLLASSFTQQGPPVGGGGGANWTIDYQIDGMTVTDYSEPGITPVHQETPWDEDPSQWRTAFNFPAFLGHGPNRPYTMTGSASGTITVRVRWTGSGSAPNHVWLKVISGALWKGDTGNCSNGQNDPKVSIVPGPGQTCDGKHIVRKSYSGSQITFNISLSSNFNCSTELREYGLGVGLSVSTTTRSATLARTDGGAHASLVNDEYVGHTLLSWTGTHDGVDYDSLPAGKTTQTLQGVVAGEWSQKEFTDPQTNQPYTTADLLIKWSGSTDGNKEYTPPSPLLTVLQTTYNGDMPNFDPQGTTPKEETWKFSVKDNQDGETLDLKWKWIAHYAHENWVENQTEVFRETVREWSHSLYQPGEDWTFPDPQPASHTVTTLWNASASPGFQVFKYHIGVSLIRTEFGDTKILEFDPNVLVPRVVYDSNLGPGLYIYRWAALNTKHFGDVDVWNKQGSKVVALGTFMPASTATAIGYVSVAFESP